MPDAPHAPAAPPFAGVLHFYAGNRYGGVESMLSTMAKSPAFVGQSYALYHRGRLFDELSAAGADVHYVGPFRTRYPWQARPLRRRMAALLAERAIHTLVTHSALPHALVAPAAGARLVVYFAHECHAGVHWTERWAKLARRPDAVVTGSACVASTTRTLFPDVEPFVVNYAAELGSPGSEAERRAVRQELATPASHKVVVCAARLTPYKGHHVMVEAFGRLSERTDWTAWIAGGAQSPFEKRYRDQLERRARELGLEGRVRFLGERRDVGRLLRGADVFCQANVEREPFGICFAEALGAGIPVVTSGMGGALEIVTPALGALVAPGDAAALADVLSRTFDDAEKARVARESGPEHARAICAPERVAARFERAFELARARRRA